MRINRLDNQTSFRALKINPKLTPKIEERGENYIAMMDNYGESLSNITRYHVVFDEDLNTPKIKSCDSNDNTDYFAKLHREELFLGQHYVRECGMDETATGFYPNEPNVFIKLYGKEEAKGMYKLFKELTLYEKAAEYSKMLDALAAKRAQAECNKVAAELYAMEQRSKLQEKANELTEKYKYTAHVTTQKNDDNNTKKQGFWSRMADLLG